MSIGTVHIQIAGWGNHRKVKLSGSKVQIEVAKASHPHCRLCTKRVGWFKKTLEQQGISAEWDENGAVSIPLPPQGKDLGEHLREILSCKVEVWHDLHDAPMREEEPVQRVGLYFARGVSPGQIVFRAIDGEYNSAWKVGFDIACVPQEGKYFLRVTQYHGMAYEVGKNILHRTFPTRKEALSAMEKVERAVADLVDIFSDKATT